LTSPIENLCPQPYSSTPLELFFEPGRGSQDDADFPPLAGHGIAQDDYSTSGSGGGYGAPSAHSSGGQSSAGKSGKSSITHETEPTSEITQTMEELVQAAVAASTAKMAKDFQELRAENARIKADFQALQTSIAALPAQLWDGTLVALRSPSPPMYEMQQMMMAFMQKVEVSLTEFRMEASRSSESPKSSSPPRKVSRSDPPLVPRVELATPNDRFLSAASANTGFNLSKAYNMFHQ
jgi:hypothetical protein